MEPFDDILIYMQTKKGEGGGWGSVVVKAVCEGYTGHEPPRNFIELDTFLYLFTEAVKLEAKAGVEKRLTALDFIREWADRYEQSHGKNSQSEHFIGVGLLPFAFQLALRVRKPALFDQAQTALCGTVALVYTFGKESPIGLATLGIDLFSLGVGNFRGIRLEPSLRTKQKYTSRKKTNLMEADYVVLSSVRECGGVSNLGEGFHVGNQTLTAGTIGTMLQNAGYSDVVDHTFIQTGGLRKQVEKTLNQNIYFEKRGNLTNPGNRNQKLLSLLQAQQELESGRFVLLLGHGDIATAVRDKSTRIRHKLIGHSLLLKTIQRHWTAVRRINVDQGRGVVELRLISWGQRHDGTLELNDFLDLYEGYVSASP